MCDDDIRAKLADWLKRVLEDPIPFPFSYEQMALPDGRQITLSKSHPDSYTSVRNDAGEWDFTQMKDFNGCHVDASTSDEGKVLAVETDYPGDVGVVPWTVKASYRRNPTGCGVILDRLPPRPHLAFRNLVLTGFTEFSQVATIVISAYCSAKSSTGHPCRICYYSLRADRDVFNSLMPENLNTAQFLAHFLTRDGLTFSNTVSTTVFSLRTVSPFTSDFGVPGL